LSAAKRAGVQAWEFRRALLVFVTADAGISQDFAATAITAVLAQLDPATANHAGLLALAAQTAVGALEDALARLVGALAGDAGEAGPADVWLKAP
jgi:hypothetical protein